MTNDEIRKFNAFRSLCIRNAEDTIKGAELLLNKNLNHIVFHLSLLGLEEVGKIFMTWIKINQVENWHRESNKIELDDHVKKLFYAIWGPSIGREIINSKQITENNLTATKLHSLRLFYLYSTIDDKIESSAKISDEEAQDICDFAKSRLELAKIEGEIAEETVTESDSYAIWFDNFLKIPAKADFAFGKIGQEKLVELNDVNKWFKWLKETYEKEQQQLLEIAEKEIERKEVDDAKKFIPKWEISFTIYSPSHSIRNKDINALNKFEKPFKFFLGKDRHTLIIKYQLPSFVTAHDLWQQGWLTSKLFVGALNISSRGVFYWHAPKDVDKFYDSVLDIESNKRLTISLNPKLALNWEERKMYLSEQQLHLTFMVYEYFIRSSDSNDMRIMMDYMSALAMFARTDIHLRLELNSFMAFFCVFEALVTKHEKANDSESIFEVGLSQIAAMIKGRIEYDKNIKLAQELRNGNVILQPISLREVVAMKNYCDIYLLTISYRTLYNQPEVKLAPTDSEMFNEN